ncbi:hypothetical protein [Actomonas aquatica]|uniref:DUF4394 domain-containing protein n=1 Tax=Actomonas aquatica TaxID=2866162 RepID=A0ABZ1C4L5_9BACT|nr:hypothetical protein [Opitutus sp. WL0086]WRQ86183.1 hypothetical protein K1X11_015315 [Opitutus sp. WL0086]
MNLPYSKFLAMAVAGALTATAEVAYTPPLGVEVLTIDGGTSAAPVTTPLALTLVDRPVAAGLQRGAITTVGATTLTVSGAGWTADALAVPAFPYDVLIIDGAGAGARLQVTANTADTLTVAGRDLATLGVSDGDHFQLLPVDTLDSLFGSDTFLGGESPEAADVIALGEQTRLSYYYNTTAGQWQLTTGATDDAGATRLPPNGMIAVVRKADAFTLTLAGAAPVTATNIPVADLGTTFTHTGFPLDVTLDGLALQTHLAGWASNSDVDQADLLAVATGASWVNYYHDGSQWVRAPGATTNRGAVVIPAGTPIRIIKRSGVTGSTPLVLPLPYSL